MDETMKILMVYPEYPVTFWSFDHALKFISKKAAYPPLGLITVAAMLPQDWEVRLIDLNIEKLKDRDLEWADYVMISAMLIQKQSVHSILQRCRSLGKKVVAGGPLFNSTPQEYLDLVDHLILNEAEITLPLFLADLEKGSPQKVYRADTYPELSMTPTPRWDLIKIKKYATLMIQCSRGCPYDCEFCDITTLYGRRPRVKDAGQLLGELQAIYDLGWRGTVFIVDDNFIGNKKKLKAEILPALIEWKNRIRYPFALCTEASINLSDDEELMGMMVAAGFDVVFVGIETPNDESLIECTKYQNQNRNLVDSVKKLQKFGLEVQGGFIVGFDNDPESIFQTQIDFIQNSGIVTAMVGLLNAPTGTRLYRRLKEEGRLNNSFTGSNTDFSLNFIPKMDYDKLINGYRHILDTIYSPREYYQRIRTFLQEYKPPRTKPGKVHSHQIKALFRSIWFLGIRGKGKRHYWSLFISYLMKSPPKFARFIVFSVYGYHFRKVAVAETW